MHKLGYRVRGAWKEDSPGGQGPRQHEAASFGAVFPVGSQLPPECVGVIKNANSAFAGIPL
jgi:hypothetical protein